MLRAFALRPHDDFTWLRISISMKYAIVAFIFAIRHPSKYFPRDEDFDAYKEFRWPKTRVSDVAELD